MSEFEQMRDLISSTYDYPEPERVPLARARSDIVTSDYVTDSRTYVSQSVVTESLRARVRESWARMGALYRIEVLPLSEKQEAWLWRSREACYRMAGPEATERADTGVIKAWGLWSPRYGPPKAALKAAVHVYDHAIRDSLLESEA